MKALGNKYLCVWHDLHGIYYSQEYSNDLSALHLAVILPLECEPYIKRIR